MVGRVRCRIVDGDSVRMLVTAMRIVRCYFSRSDGGDGILAAGLQEERQNCDTKERRHYAMAARLPS